MAGVIVMQTPKPAETSAMSGIGASRTGTSSSSTSRSTSWRRRQHPSEQRHLLRELTHAGQRVAPNRTLDSQDDDGLIVLIGIEDEAHDKWIHWFYCTKPSRCAVHTAIRWKAFGACRNLVLTQPGCNTTDRPSHEEK